MSGYSYSDSKIEDFIGKTFVKVEKTSEGDEIHFFLDDKAYFNMRHHQDCCESVYVEDIAGDLEDLVGSPILLAEENSNSDDPAKNEYEESWTWTFYRIGTIKGAVVIRWYGSSNGYYSESVSIDKVEL